MIAARLRTAALVLRHHANAATPGPWGVADHWGLDGERAYVVSEADVPNYVSAGGGLGEDNDAPYIATMHPGVALALADWLDDTAREVASHATYSPEALKVADLILGAEEAAR